MKWQKIISKLDLPLTEFQLNKPNQETSKIVSEFKVELPIELVEFYNETNGIHEVMNGKNIGDLIWSIERLIQENRMYRTTLIFKETYMSFHDLLFIGDLGNGDSFGYSIQEDKIQKTDIFAWNHENDSRDWIAPSLETFVKEWTSGKIVL